MKTDGVFSTKYRHVCFVLYYWFWNSFVANTHFGLQTQIYCHHITQHPNSESCRALANRTRLQFVKYKVTLGQASIRIPQAFPGSFDPPVPYNHLYV